MGGQPSPNNSRLTDGIRIFEDINIIHQFGDVVTTDAKSADIYDNGDTVTRYPWLNAAEKLDVVSADANDAGAGTAAQTIEIHGLNASYERLTATVTLNGVTPVEDVQGTGADGLFYDWFRVNHAMTIDYGGDPDDAIGTNEGNITMTGATSGKVLATILAGEGHTLMTMYTIPTPLTLALDLIQIHVEESPTKKPVLVNFCARQPGKAWQVFHKLHLISGTARRTFEVPRIFAAKTDLFLQAVTLEAVAVGAEFEGRLIGYDISA